MKSIELTVCSLLRRPSALAAALLFAAAAAHAADYNATVLADNPVAYYELQELPGTNTAFDSTTNALDGAYSYNSLGSPEQGLPGIDTNSILFSYGTGSSDFGFISLPANTTLAPVNPDGITGAPFSAEAWVQATTVNTPDYIVPVAMSGAYGTGLYNNGSGWNFYQSQTSPQSWQVFMRTSNQVAILPGVAVVLLQWTHLAVTWDGTNATFYVNGQAASSSALPGYLADPGAGNGEIGGPGETGHGAFEGGVDQVAFYTNVLTAAQILNHYNIGTNSIRAPLAAPSFVAQPSLPTTTYSGVSLSLTALAAGTTPLSYQWYSNNVAIAGQTNATLTFVPVYPSANGAAIYVNVSNSVGTTNSVTNTLTLLTNVTVIAPPYSITRNVGSHAAFRIATIGAQPFGYQWFSSPDGAAFTTLTNQTGDTLWLTNVQASQNGNEYWVLVTNPFTSYSNFAVLTVQPRAVTETFTGYGAVISNDNPVAFYRLNEATNSTTATDAVGSFDGNYNVNTGPIDFQYPVQIPGDTNVGIAVFDPQSAVVSEGGQVDIPYALELNPYGNWSFEGWFQPTSQDPNNYRTVCSSMCNSNSSAALFGWLIYQHPASAFTLVTFNGTGGPATFISDFGHIPLNIGSWYHLALVDNGSTIQLYVNGVAGSANGPASAFVPNGVNGDPSIDAANSVLGQRSDPGSFFGFNGGVDEVAFYNYALSPSQIQLHYLGSTTLTLSKSGGQTILTWPLGTLYGTTNLAQPFTPVSGAHSPYTVPMTSPQFFYKVVLN